MDEDYAAKVRRAFLYMEYHIRRWRTQQNVYVYVVLGICVCMLLLLIVNSPLMYAARHVRRHKMPALHLRAEGVYEENAKPSRYVAPLRHIIKRRLGSDPCAPVSDGGDQEQYKRYLERDLELHLDGKQSPDAEDFIKLLPHDTVELHAGHEHGELKTHASRREEMTYKVSHVRTRDPKTILFKISESFRGNLTSGGSGFKASLRGRHTELLCPVRDNFNGVYMVCCPVVEDNSVVEIQQTYVDFAAFSGVPLQPRVLPVFKANIRKYAAANEDTLEPKKLSRV